MGGGPCKIFFEKTKIPPLQNFCAMKHCSSSENFGRENRVAECLCASRVCALSLENTGTNSGN